MSSTYAPLPFSYLASDPKQPTKKTGFRREEGLYGSRTDIVKPIPGLRHDKPPPTAADWKLGGASTDVVPVTDAAVDVYDNRLGSDDGNYTSAFGVRLPRAEVYNGVDDDDDDDDDVVVVRRGGVVNEAAAVDDRGRPAVKARPLSQFPPVEDRTYATVDQLGDGADRNPRSLKPTMSNDIRSSPVGETYGNFILVDPKSQDSKHPVGVSYSAGPKDGRPTDEVEMSVSTAADVKPPLATIFDGQPNGVAKDRLPRMTNDVAVNGLSDKAYETPGYQLYSGNNGNLVGSNVKRDDWSPVLESRPDSFGAADTRLVDRSRSPHEKRAESTGCPCGCTRSELAAIIIIIILIAAIMFGAGFIAGWFGSKAATAAAAGAEVSSTTTPVVNPMSSSSTTSRSSTAVVDVPVTMTTKPTSLVAVVTTAAAANPVATSSTTTTTTTTTSTTSTTTTTPASSGSSSGSSTAVANTITTIAANYTTT